MKIIVVGAGVIGVTTAYYLALEGHHVTVIDRLVDAGDDTSFANGGQISVSHAEPWANPSTPLKALQWLGKDDAPLLWKWSTDIKQWMWGAQFLFECTKPRWRRNIRNIVNLATYSRDLLADVRSTANIDNHHLQKGIIHFYTDSDEWVSAQKASKVLSQYGCDRHPLTVAELTKLEPALQSVGNIVGGTYTADDESGDAHLFTRQLAQYCAEQLGVTFMFNTEVHELITDASKEDVFGVVVSSGTDDEEREDLSADRVVICAASFAPRLLDPLGISIAVYPVKGYSATIPILNPDKAPTVSLTDDGHKIVFSRLGNNLRVAGTAEFNGFDASWNPTRSYALTNRTRELFGDDNFDWDQTYFWNGIRPATPSNVPYIGPTRVANLFLNVGHGTLGWTMACGSGSLLAMLIDERRPPVDFCYLGRKN